ncbi:MAG: heavy metal-responsive transcriptional regulator [Stanieria sp.]
MLKIGQVAQKLGLNPQTLYFYERIGLMKSPQRTEAGYRIYEDEDLERLLFITRAKALGLTLEEIKQLLTLKEGKNLFCEEVYNRLSNKMEQIEKQIEQLQALKAELLPLLELCRVNAQRKGNNSQCVVFGASDDKISADI